MKIIRAPKPRLSIVRNSAFWSVHTHSAFSAQDAMPSVTQIVDTVAALGQQGIGLTDHGNMAGSVQLYQAAKRAGIKPFPGSELYLVKDIDSHKAHYRNKEIEDKRYHLGVVAYSTTGYENLVNLSTLTHKQFYFKPLIDLKSLAQLAEDGKTEGLAITTGCYFGLIVQSLVNEGVESATRYLRALDSWFPGSVYVEIQNHHIDHGDGWNDEQVADALTTIAQGLGLPVVITQDSHYACEQDRSDHDALKRLVAFGPDPDEVVFPGDGFHLADDAWIADHHSGARLEAGLAGLQHLLDRHDLEIPVLDRYRYSVPITLDDPDARLEQRCRDSLVERGLDQARYRDRLNTELAVVKASGMAGYLLLAAEVTDYMTAQKILFQTRGSAAGSLCVWLLGISNQDPIRWNLRFERFLSKDRNKPPDIDFDIQHDRRADVMAWMSTKWSVHQIGTWAVMGMDGDEDGSKGSLLIKYYASATKQGRDVHQWSQIPASDRAVLRSLAGRKMFTGPGTNAAGVVVTATKAEFDKLVPLMWIASSKTMLTQYHKDDIEKMGFVKLDVMGIKMLTVISRALKLIGKEDLAWIPNGHGPTYSAIRSGQTDGVFQLSGFAAQRGCRDLKPTRIQDVIAAMALFRPATMNSGATASYIRRKHGREEIPPRHPIIAEATRDTYGIMLYQEQVIAILRSLGMNADDLTKFLKAVKASNKDIGDAGTVIKNYQVLIGQLCDQAGMSQTDQQWLATAIDGFSAYGFNSAHATVYGHTAYQTAYLMVTHPNQFHTALLAVAAGDPAKEPGYLKAARTRGVKVLNPDINISQETYTYDERRKAVRKGLRAIHGIGKTVARELIAHQPYTSLTDLLTRVDHRKVTGVKDLRLADQTELVELSGSMKALYEAGALNSLIEKY